MIAWGQNVQSTIAWGLLATAEAELLLQLQYAQVCHSSVPSFAVKGVNTPATNV